MLDGCHLELTEAGPCRRRACRAQSRVATPGFCIQQGAERPLPAGAERGDAQGTKQLLSRVAREVEERADPGDRHFLRARRELEDLVAGLCFPLLQDAEIEARSVVGDEERWNARIFHPDPDAVTGHA